MDILFHTTYANRIESIAESGLSPDEASSIGSAAYDQHRDGGVFLSDEDGIHYWHERAEEWANNKSDDVVDDGLIPVVLRVRIDIDEECEDDEVGSSDSRHEAFKCFGGVEPENIEIWSGHAWLPVHDWGRVDMSLGHDEDGYLAGSFESPLVPTGDEALAPSVRRRI